MTGSPSSNQPLSAGNIVSAAVKIYRSRLSQFLGVAFTATLWMLPPVLAALIILFIMGIAFSPTSGSGSPLGLFSIVLWLGWIVLACFCSAKNLMNTALISRLAYGELTSQPESVQDGRGQLNSKHWKFFRISLYASLFLFCVNLGLNLASGIVQGITGTILSNSPISGFIALILALAVIIAGYWVQASLFISEVPLAVEGNLSSIDSIRRGWNLSQGSAGQIILAIIIATLITLPLVILAFIPFILTLIANASFLASTPETFSPATAIAIFISLAISFLLSLFLGIFIVPFWQSMKALIYFNLRGWREGADLKLRT
jgi:hypothetical protein